MKKIKTLFDIISWLIVSPLKWLIKNIPRTKYQWSLLFNSLTLVYVAWFILLFPIVLAKAPEAIMKTEKVKDKIVIDVTPTVGSKEWVLWYVEKEGIDPVKVNCLVTKESGWNPNASNVNKNGTIDLGLFMWNDYWQIKKAKFITMGCIGDVVCETYKFVEKVKQDQNLEAWHGYTNHCLWLGTNPFIK